LYKYPRHPNIWHRVNIVWESLSFPLTTGIVFLLFLGILSHNYNLYIVKNQEDEIKKIYPEAYPENIKRYNNFIKSNGLGIKTLAEKGFSIEETSFLLDSYCSTEYESLLRLYKNTTDTNTAIKLLKFAIKYECKNPQGEKILEELQNLK
jgi:hypothetical protein